MVDTLFERSASRAIQPRFLRARNARLEVAILLLVQLNAVLCAVLVVAAFHWWVWL